MIINHNMMAANANRMANINQNNASKAMAKLSSGLRINGAADDASGLAISEKMKGQINGLNQASSNAQNAVSLTQTADGALSETTSVLQRMRELAVQSSNDTNTSADRTAIQTETSALTAQIDNIANTTQFNTKSLLNGGAGVQVSQTVGTGALVVGGAATVVAGTVEALTSVTAAKSATVTFTSSATTKDLVIGTAGATLSVNGISIGLAANMTGANVATTINAQTALTGVTANYTVASAGSKGTLVLSSSATGSAANIKLSGVDLKQLGSAAAGITDTAAGLIGMTNTAGATMTAGADVSAATVNTDAGTDASATASIGTISSQGNVLTFHGVGVEGLQVNVANASATSTLNVDANNSLTMQIGANQGQTMSISINNMSATSLGVNALDLSTQSGAANAITAIDVATAAVSNTRSQLGAYQNRLASTINNLGTTSQNLSSAQSQITDVDMAATMAEFSKDNVESQAAQAMIAQANQQPQQVLQLLR